VSAKPAENEMPSLTVYGQQDPTPHLDALTRERDAAVREAAELRRFMATLEGRVQVLTERATRAELREKQTRAQLLLTHDQIARNDAEFRSITQILIGQRVDSEQRLHRIIQDVAAHRDELETRLLRLSQSPPARLYRRLRALFQGPTS
jgi:hypothetical protein